MADDSPRRLRRGAVHKATAAELAGLGLDPQESGLAQTALRLATELDCAATTRDAAAVGRELRAVLADIHKAAPAPQEEDAVDELAAQRAARRGA